MSNDSTVWNPTPDNSTGWQLAPDLPSPDGSVLLLVLLLVLGGALVMLAALLIVCCHRRHGCRYPRAGDDPEKTNTTYMEESQPTHAEITIRVDEADCLSASSSHDQETERFLSTGTTGRRVSFNEAALFDHGKKAQEKGRRYTLTEGDFHHLKNARLTNLHIPPPSLRLPPPSLHLPPPVLRILTIHECDSPENSITMTTRPESKSALSIFQPALCPLPQTALTGLSVSPSSALPGDTLNSLVDSSFRDSPPSLTPPTLRTKQLSTSSIEVGGGSRNGGSPGGGSVCEGGSAGPPAGLGGQGPVLQFFNRLRRHASLEGASPYFRIRRWRLDSSQRASSLDTKGSPKRRQFQRQRAASESMDQEDHDHHHIDLIQYITRTQDTTYCPGRSARLLNPPSPPPPSLGRLEVEVVVEPSCSREGSGVIGMTPEPQDDAVSFGCHQESSPPEPLDLQDPQAVYRDIWTLRASLEQFVSDHSNDKDSVRSNTDSVCSLGGRGELLSFPSQDLGDEEEAEGQEGLQQELKEGQEKEKLGGEKGEGKEDSLISEQVGSEGESGTRKLLQMDSGYASIEAPTRAHEDLRLFPTGGGGGGKERTALEKRHHFTSAGRTGTVGESFDAQQFLEEPEEEGLAVASGGVAVDTGAGPLGWSPYGQMFTPHEAHPLPVPPVLHRRDYSIDEKTDALFHEFLRHDPQFDQQESPLKKHRSRVHLRKQWQRHKQYSDPGVRYHTSFDRYRTPLRRGDSVNYPLETSYHSTLPRIVSTPDEEASEGGASGPQTPKEGAIGAREGEQEEEVGVEEERRRDSPSSVSNEEEQVSCSPPTLPARATSLEAQEPVPQPQDSSYGPQTVSAELTDKLAARLEDRLYTDLQRTMGTAEGVVAVTHTVTHTSPDHSPV